MRILDIVALRTVKIHAYSPDQPRDNHGRFGSGDTPVLTREERVTERFHNKVNSDPEAAKAEYRAQWPKIVSADNAKELSPDYRRDRSLAGAVHDTASALAKSLVADAIAAPVKPGDEPVMIFTAGIPGAGKTTALEGTLTTKQLMETAHGIYDATLRKFTTTDKFIKDTVASGKLAVVLFIHRDPEEAWRDGVLRRAAESGRIVPLSAMLEAVHSVQDTMKSVQDKYRTDPHVVLRVLDNSFGKGKAKETDLASLPKPPSTNVLRARLTAITEELYHAGKISKAIRDSSLA